jgi:hypothetical protein
MVEEIITRLEMTAPSQLLPGRPPPAHLELHEVGRDEAPLLRSTCERIGAPFGWTGRSTWSDAQWETELARPGVQTWLARVDEEVAGLVELESEPNGDVGIVVLGLVPEFVGKVRSCTPQLATRRAWKLKSPQGDQTRRVVVQTSSRDHPHARPSYERRGFRVVETE